ncbi:hypothetical protein SALWKB12_0159 [Snodgrassella communis]|nr:hypothetical protein SALWKB12_0159 [Snodgrassella communis]
MKNTNGTILHIQPMHKRIVTALILPDLLSRTAINIRYKTD